MRNTVIKLLFAYLLFMAINAPAQSIQQQRLDSLIALLPKTTKQDTNRARLLMNIGRAHINANKFDKGTEYLQQAMDLGAKIKWPLATALGYRYMGIAELRKNNFEKYVTLSNQAIKVAETAGLDTVKYVTIYALGNNALRIKKDTAAALNYYKAVLPYFRKIKKPILLHTLLADVGTVYYNRNDENTAVAYFDEALKTAAQIDTRAQIIKTYEMVDRAYIQHRNDEKSLATGLSELKYFKDDDTTTAHLAVLNHVGIAYSNLKKPNLALGHFLKNVRLIGLIPNVTPFIKDNLFVDYVYIGENYRQINDNEKALDNYYKAEKLSDSGREKSIEYVIMLTGISTILYDQKQYDKALIYTQKLTASRRSIPQLNGYNLVITASVQIQTGNYNTGHKLLKQVLPADLAMPEVKAMYDLASGILVRDAPDSILIKDNIPLAQRYQKAVSLIESGTKVLERSAVDFPYTIFEELSLAYQKAKNYQAAYDTYKRFIVLRDSVRRTVEDVEIKKKFAQFEFAKKEDSLKYQQQLTTEQLKRQTLLATQQEQALLINQQKLSLANRDNENQHLKFLQTQANLQSEQNARKANEQALKASQNASALADQTVQLQKIDILNRERQSYYLFGGIAGLLGLSFFIARNYRNQRKSNRQLTAANTLVTDANKQITAEKQRSDDLLLNILPADVAEELKEKGSANARLFNEVTVLFTDFVNFTTISQLLTPQQLVDELNYCFVAFDHIITAHGIEKIKTIGDAYLAVCGLPNSDSEHAAKTVKAALEIQQFIQKRKAEMGDKTFDVRIGIHSGSVVAGIVGVKKFAYDIWGDTVNTAARMEQNSEPGKINVSGETYELVKDKFAFTYRGEIAAKNKGALKMYFADIVIEEAVI